MKVEKDIKRIVQHKKEVIKKIEGQIKGFEESLAEIEKLKKKCKK